LISPSFWRLVRDIFRFNHIAAKELRKGLGDLTLGQFLEKYSFSKSYIDFHIIPVSAAVWSTPSERILDFPAESILRFYDNHGLLSLTNRPQWKTVVGGSISYIRAFEKQFQGVIRRASPVRSVTRVRNKIRVAINDGTQLDFDFVVLATHADTSLRLLIDPETDEKTILSKWSYTKNPVALHTDGQVMPPRRSAWASWNYTRNHREGNRPALNLSYYMNRLQRLNTVEDYFVTLNGDGWFNPDRCIESIIFDHPCYTFDSLSTHKALETINGKDRVYYCGAYCGFGFHEDGARSGLAVAKKFGIGL
jgi:predicted NAD/FAD-binding protein